MTQLEFDKPKLSKTQILILSKLPTTEPGLLAEEVRDRVIEIKGMLVETASRRLRELVNLGYARTVKVKMIDCDKTYVRWIRL